MSSMKSSFGSTYIFLKDTLLTQMKRDKRFCFVNNSPEACESTKAPFSI